MLGLIPTQHRLRILLTGFSAAAAVCVVNYLLQTLLSKSSWSVNPSYTLVLFFRSVWWNLHGVLYEELLFRGALLYLAIRFLGLQKGCLLSAVCFGVYHWFSMGAFGNVVLMVYLFIGTGLMGYVFALAYGKTKTLYLPVGLHFGWNLVNNLVFSRGPQGTQLLIKHAGESLNGFEQVFVMLVSTFLLPFCGWMLVRRVGDR